MGVHYALGPSKAKQWKNCPGSIALCAKAPPQAPNFAAAEGSVAHDIAEKFVTGKIDSIEMNMLIGTTVKQDGFDVEVTEEMFDGAVEYKELIDGLRDELLQTPGGMKVEGFAEVEVHAKSVDERAKGTADYILFKKGKKLIVVDYKFGQGVIVDPEENDQGSLYLLGAMETLAGSAFDELEIIIHQPRGRHVDGPVRRWVVPKDWLEKFRLETKEQAAETLRADARLKAGDWCRWCNAKPFCPEVRKGAQEAAMATFDVLPKGNGAVDVRLLPIEKIATLLHWEGAIKALIEASKDVVRERLSAGLPVPGWKLVDGREGNREWIDEDAVVAHFGAILGHDKMYVKKVVSPAALEKIVGKKGNPLAEFVTRAPGGKAIAPDTDPRPVAVSAAQDTFGVVQDAEIVRTENGVAVGIEQPDTYCAECDIMGTCSRHAQKNTSDDIMAQLGAGKAAPEKREPIWP